MMVTVRVGDTANFTLNQPNNCVCSRKQQTVTINGRYGLVNNNDGTANLTISQVTKDDYGLYTCVWNSDINTMIQFSLIVVGELNRLITARIFFFYDSRFKSLHLLMTSAFCIYITYNSNIKTMSTMFGQTLNQLHILRLTKTKQLTNVCFNRANSHGRESSGIQP